MSGCLMNENRPGRGGSVFDVYFFFVFTDLDTHLE